jgi:anti-sigma regulatory factor (Ser/Thr protein kinase)
MPYYRCPACALTVHSAAGRFTANLCPNCSAPLSTGDRIEIHERHPAAISRRFRAQPDAASAARRELERLLWALDSAEFQVLSLLVTELIANTVKHTNGSGGMIRLEITLTDDLARVEVHDPGRGFNPAARDDASPLDSHWGLHLVESLTDRWGVDAEPDTRVWFELDRASADVGRAQLATAARQLGV